MNFTRSVASVNGCGRVNAQLPDHTQRPRGEGSAQPCTRREGGPRCGCWRRCSSGRGQRFCWPRARCSFTWGLSCSRGCRRGRCFPEASEPDGRCRIDRAEFLRRAGAGLATTTSSSSGGGTGSKRSTTTKTTRRKNDGFDPTLDNWPARNWPTPADLQDARRRYPEPMFVDAAAMKVAAPDFDAEDDVFEAMVVWRMERETV